MGLADVGRKHEPGDDDTAGTEGRQGPARPATSVPEPPAEMTVLESLLASNTPEASASADLPAPETSDLPRRRNWLVLVVIMLVAALGALAWIYGFADR